MKTVPTWFHSASFRRILPVWNTLISPTPRIRVPGIIMPGLCPYSAQFRSLQFDTYPRVTAKSALSSAYLTRWKTLTSWTSHLSIAKAILLTSPFSQPFPNVEISQTPGRSILMPATLQMKDTNSHFRSNRVQRANQQRQLRGTVSSETSWSTLTFIGT